MINPHRGEVAIKLVRANGEGTDDLVLRPTFTAICALEHELDIGIAGILRRFSERRYGMRDIIAIVTHGLEATGHPERRELIAERVALTGLERLSVPALQFCMAGWSGGGEQDPMTLPTMPATATPAATGSPPGNGLDSLAQP
jgi:tail tube GTA-gp10-like protein